MFSGLLENKLKKLLTNKTTSDILKKLSRLTTKQRTLITEQWITLKDSMRIIQLTESLDEQGNQAID